MMPNICNESTQNSWHNRRVYSALSRILTNKQKEGKNSKSKSKSRSISKITSKNMSKNVNISKKSVNGIKINKRNILNQKSDINLIRQLNIKKTTFQQVNYSIVNKFKFTKNKSKK